MTLLEIRKTGYYLCRECSTTFCFVNGTLSCPCCDSCDSSPETLLIYVDDDSDIAEMYTKVDFSAGD